ncbi:MAG TPA: hypothetical protein VL981_10085 [Candidatus Methylacidiphilales bacterium]|nr:hypothetical protein [Candidatus Methylacidiphilales bacterium]
MKPANRLNVSWYVAGLAITAMVLEVNRELAEKENGATRREEFVLA